MPRFLKTLREIVDDTHPATRPRAANDPTPPPFRRLRADIRASCGHRIGATLAAETRVFRPMMCD